MHDIKPILCTRFYDVHDGFVTIASEGLVRRVWFQNKYEY